MSASVDKDLESKMLNLFRRMSVCAAHHQEKDSEWIDGQCVTPSTATKEAVKLIEDHDKALKQELKQSLEAQKKTYRTNLAESPYYRDDEAVPMEAIEALFQDKGDNRE